MISVRLGEETNRFHSAGVIHDGNTCYGFAVRIIRIIRILQLFFKLGKLNMRSQELERRCAHLRSAC